MTELDESSDAAGCRYRINDENLVWRILDGEAVIVDTQSSAYFGLNPAATVLWQPMTTQAVGVAELADLLTSTFDQPPERAAVETTTFLDQALHAGLIVKADGARDAGDPHQPSEPIHGGEYEPPQIIPFGDLDALILSGEW